MRNLFKNQALGYNEFNRNRNVRSSARQKKLVWAREKRVNAWRCSMDHGGKTGTFWTSPTQKNIQAFCPIW